MKKIISLVICATMFVSLFGFSLSVNSVDSDAEVKIMYTNDTHGTYKYDEATATTSSGTSKNTAISIGFSKLKSVYKNKGADVMLSAGDLFDGTTFAKIEKGEAIAEIVKAVGYDFMAVGNHDLNFGTDRLLELEKLSGLSILSGNVKNDNGSDFFKNSYSIKEINGVKVGFFATLDPTVYKSVSSNLVKGTVCEDEIKQTEDTVKKLQDSGCNIIIAVTHHNNISDYVSKISGVDLVIAGHVHSIFNELYPDSTGKKIPVTESGYNFGDIGLASFKYDKGTGKFNCNIQSISADEVKDSNVESDPQIDALIEQIENRQNDKNPVITNIKTYVPYSWEDVRCKEMDICRIISDAFKNTANDVDFAIVTAANARDSIKSGDLRQWDVLSVLGFEGELISKKVTGSNIKTMFETSMSLVAKNLDSNNAGAGAKWDSHSGDVIYPSNGVEIHYDLNKPDNEKIQNIFINGEPIDNNREYTIAMNEYTSTLPIFPEFQQSETLNNYGSLTSSLGTYLSNVGVDKSIGNVRCFNKLKDDASGVIIKYGQGVIPEDAVLNVKKHEKGSQEYKTIFNNIDPEYRQVAEKVGVYEISILDKNGTKLTKFNPSIAVMIPVPSGYNLDDLRAISVKEISDISYDKNLQLIDGVNYYSFSSDYVDVCALINENYAVMSSNMIIFIGIGVLILIGAITFIIIRKRHKTIK